MKNVLRIYMINLKKKINSYKTYAILIVKYFWNGSSLGHKYIFLTITYNFFPPCSLFRFDVLIKWNTERNFLNVIWLFFFYADAKKEKGNYFQLKCVLILKGKEKKKEQSTKGRENSWDHVKRIQRTKKFSTELMVSHIYII